MEFFISTQRKGNKDKCIKLKPYYHFLSKIKYHIENPNDQ